MTAAGAIVAGAVGIAEPPALDRIVRAHDTGTLTVVSGRPLAAAAALLAREFGLQINVEDPVAFSRLDLEDVTAQVSRVPNPQRRTLTPRSRLLELAFPLTAEGHIADVRTLVDNLVDRENNQGPIKYRIDQGGDEFTLVATRTRDDRGRVVDAMPLLDHRVTIPAGTRRVFEHMNLLTKALEAQTGVRVGCCQAIVGGIPWGSTVITFEAHDQPARAVLRRLVNAAPGRFHWLMRCEPGASWCFVNVSSVQVAVER